ncbi:auxin efflux carrier [Lineolata rhizophorae]|uniref:Auxin efflux carrier n=1 Tax=Lineolata rhizophorae TaxID=578093 RepID=A0A6A6PBD2_9PEZI|nr:auxin efflux carrier [Lineolata rhizophorae]
MSSGGSGILVSFLGALQASVAVLLTIFYGVIAAQFSLISEGSARDVSKACVRLFLPALLITKVGSELHLDTLSRYIPIFIWAIVYNALSVALGITLTKLFKLPAWTTPGITFNNTTSLPLLLVQSLEASGILRAILMGPDDSNSAAIARAESYFLVNSMVSNSLTFALGPKLLGAQEEDAPEKVEEVENGNHGEQGQENNGDVEQGAGEPHEQDDNNDVGNRDDQQQQQEGPNERTSLLPTVVAHNWNEASKRSYKRGSHYFSRLPSWLQSTLAFLYSFCNAPVVGAVIGAVIGLVPALHRVFFAGSQQGGVLNAWLTSSIKNIGDLFAALQVVVVGVKLSQSMRRMKKGEASGKVPWTPFVLITLVRYVVWPVVSIPLVWALATRTGVLGKDPILWFTMMLMPTGPPAMKLTALTDVNGSSEQEKMSVAKFLTISYTISPLICFAVVGSLKASEAAVGQ